jgi:hypothetical protein
LLFVVLAHVGRFVISLAVPAVVVVHDLGRVVSRFAINLVRPCPKLLAVVAVVAKVKTRNSNPPIPRR